ncbi:DNA-methyltransferase [Desulfobacula phenolica]|uniref:site-specific DNA-methyltransferase (adenine-specific) n=1 Tax=Desulfobacula phenolica TaxID=90732 RepID=A0A1H2K4Z0_9BACT|nr:site-specific DNA-methyltransferase [Desulfobacula phenolica]SDU63468.1 site-specific DNA-methyltransferase (adenine-specific) [Desulfobacula phenolica]
MFFKALQIEDRLSLNRFSKKTGISAKRLKYYNDGNKMPTGKDLNLILKNTDLSKIELMLLTETFNHELKSLIAKNAQQIEKLLSSKKERKESKNDIKTLFETELGKLYQCDCLDLLKTMESDSVDIVFADPPFNLNKLYPSRIDDDLKTEQYLSWCENWAYECTRVLKPGGSFFTWNLPKWNTYLSEFLNSILTFRHWISVDIKYSLPVRGRLYPSHYSLLYYCKGEKPNTFHPDRLPMGICPHCYGDLKDYGGYKNKMNPDGINISDVWLDIPPVRHAKYKKRNGSNELSVKLLDRIIEMSSNKGDVVFDPFGGSGTTYVVSELKERKWIGVEVGPINGIIDRFNNIHEDRANLKKIRNDINALIPKKYYKKRVEKGLWTPETFQIKAS